MINMDVELHQQAKQQLETAFNILFATDCRNFDLDPRRLERELALFQNRGFSPTDKILLVHMDTDYYDPLLKFGLVPINVVRVFENLDIPLHALLFVSNHFGIHKEFDQLLEHRHLADRPRVIETFLTPTLLAESYDFVPEPCFDHIEKRALCMMGQSRSHRVAFYNFLVNNDLFDKVAVSQHFNA